MELIAWFAPWACQGVDNIVCTCTKIWRRFKVRVSVTLCRYAVTSYLLVILQRFCYPNIVETYCTHSHWRVSCHIQIAGLADLCTGTLYGLFACTCLYEHWHIDCVIYWWLGWIYIQLAGLADLCTEALLFCMSVLIWIWHSGCEIYWYWQLGWIYEFDIMIMWDTEESVGFDMTWTYIFPQAGLTDIYTC